MNCLDRYVYEQAVSNINLSPKNAEFQYQLRVREAEYVCVGGGGAGVGGDCNIFAILPNYACTYMSPSRV